MMEGRPSNLRGRMTAADLMAALRTRFAPPAHAFFEEVRNGTGYSRRERTADALAMSLWPSRGLELHGFEVKVSRGDWLRELKAPEKAEEFFRFCDAWWIVVADRTIVQPGELPPTWGLMVPRGATVKIAVEPKVRLQPEPFTKLFLASFLRRVHQTMIPEAHIKEELRRAFDKGCQAGKDEARRVREDLTHLQDRVRAFEQASGVRIEHAWDAGRVGDALRTFMDYGLDRQRDQLTAFKRELQSLLTAVEAAIGRFQNLQPEADTR